MDVGFGGPFDLAMMIHGEFNVVPREEAPVLLRRISEALRPGGRLLLEVHPSAAVEAIGHRPRTWFAVANGLFGDTTHIRMDESRWDANRSCAISLNWVVDFNTASVERFGTLTQAYSENELARLLSQSGFVHYEPYPSLTGEASDGTYTVWVASL